MSIFSKAIYKDIKLPFFTDVYSNWKQDSESGVINIEAYGCVDGEKKYLYTSYILKDVTMYERGDYEQMIQLLKDSVGKEVGVRLKYKKEKLIDFTLNLESLVQIYGDERFLELERIGWGINDKSCKDVEQ